MRKSAILSILVLSLTFTVCANMKDIRKVRAMKITHVNAKHLRNGRYRGSFSYSGFTYIVDVYVKAGRIKNIKVVQNRTTSHAKMAEGVRERVLKKQTPAVDAVTGATTTSKALMKAIENALTKGKRELQ